VSSPTSTPGSTTDSIVTAQSHLLVPIARLLNKSFPRSYATVSLLPRLALAYLWLYRLERAGVGRRLSELSLQSLKSSDTVFIFGTGSSINAYPEEYWQVIRHHDSIGMNFFLLHDHVPTFHVMESGRGIRGALLADRYIDRGDYQATPLIIKSQLTNLSTSRVKARIAEFRGLHPDVLAHTYLSIDVLAAGRTRSDMEAAYRLTHKLGLWKPKSRFLILAKRRGSVAYVINLAVRAGYRRIVLCGVDLNHTEYFYDSRREELRAANLPVPPNPEHGTVHSTNDPTNHPVTIHHVLVAIKEQILDPAGIKLLVGAESSALYPDLPCFKWKDAIAALNSDL